MVHGEAQTQSNGSPKAKLIQTRAARKAERDIFYVSIGGWDMHKGVFGGLERRFREVNQALDTPS